MSAQHDVHLVKQAKAGDSDAAGQLYDRHHRAIFRYIYGRTSQRQVAEDLTGEVFTRMIRHLSDYEQRGIPFRVWLYRIAANLVRDYHRRNHVAPLPLFMAEQVVAPVLAPDRVVEQTLTVARVRRALGAIDESQREVLILRFLAGMSLRETAQTLDKTIAAVKSLQHRGLTAVRIMLAQG